MPRDGAIIFRDLIGKLSPIVTFSGAQVPTESDVLQLHHQAHDECFIANSIQTAVEIQGTWSHVSNPR
jgi:organic hydroperoxide reductase OsmC/OhrA